jgi:hypothetical protein
MLPIKRLRQKISLIKLHRQQRGEIYIIALILLALTGLMFVPLANYVNSGIKNTSGYQSNLKDIYAADSGIQYALWKIKYDPAIIADRASFNFGQAYTYAAPAINNNSVSVTINYTWLLSGIVNLTSGATPHSTWLGMNVSGNANPTSEGSPPHSVYSISFAKSGSGNKKIEQMGVWLPAGFTYKAGSCNQYPNNICKAEPTITKVVGGSSLVWNISPSFSFQNLNPPEASQKFWYTPAGKTPKGAASWVKSQSTDIGYSWDNAIWWYTVTSTAVNITNPSKVTTINSLVSNDPKTSSGVNIVTYELEK